MTKLISFLSIFIVVRVNQSYGSDPSFSSVCKEFTGLTNVDIIVEAIFAPFVNDVQLYLYTNERSTPEIIEPTGLHMKSLSFNPTRRTTFVIHGYLNDHNTDWVLQLTQKLLEWKDMNVIVVDWFWIFERKDFNYGKSSVRTEYVGYKLHKVLSRFAAILNQPLTDWGYLHCIGHSLGAHVCGMVADQLKSERLMDRITAFDPAKPYFDDHTYLQLKKTDAKFVDVIHVNSHLNDQTFGMYEPIGHIDFYPNGGDRQPNCVILGRSLSIEELTECLSYIFFGIDGLGLVDNFVRRIAQNDNMICDHSQGQHYFIQSLTNSSKLLAYEVKLPIEKKEAECSNEICTLETCIEMGIYADQYNDPMYYGTYYLDVPGCDSGSVGGF